MGFIESDINAQFRRKNLIVKAANIIFYLWQASLTIAWLWMYIKESHFLLFYNLAVISLTASALVLLYSIVRLYREIKQLSHAKLQAREKLMVVHIFIFIASILCIAADRITNYFLERSYLENTDNGNVKCLESQSCMASTCPYLQAQWFLSGTIDVLDILVVILLIYMSVKFSKPLNQHWAEYLVSYTDDMTATLTTAENVDLSNSFFGELERLPNGEQIKTIRLSNDVANQIRNIAALIQDE